MSIKIRKRAEDMKDELVRLRRDIHQHPELGFQEFRTAALVADTLAEIGVGEIKTQVGRTGVTAQIGTGDGPTIGIRADMDALPIFEQIDKPYKSVNDGVMHACGHDAHTAMLLGAAHLLRQSFADEGDKWHGNVRFLFQPSEEQWGDDGVSGATAMIQDNAIEGLDAVIAVHVVSEFEAGVCYFWDGPALPSADLFDAYIRASGGHGAFPHYASDPIFMLSTVLTNLYGIPSRLVDPLQTNVLSIGSIQTGNAPNVIPSEIYVNGTIRAFDEGVRHHIWEQAENAFRMVEAFGGSYEFNLRKGYPSLVNDPQINTYMRKAATDLFGSSRVVERQFGMAGEDFAIMALDTPGAMFSLGAGVEGGGSHHTPLFDIDEDVLPVGAAVLAEAARRFVMREE